MWTQLCIAFGLASLLLGAAFGADESLEAQYRVGPLYDNVPGEVSVVVQLPYGVTKPAADNFKLLLDGKRELEYPAHKTRSFLESGQELAWLLCVDVSGSITREKLRDIQEALLTFLGDRKALRIALMDFASEIHMRLTFQDGDDREAVTGAVRGLKDAGPKSQTLLYDALIDALDYYAQKYAGDLESGPRRKRILVISDGQNDGGVVNTPDSVESRSLALDVPIDAIGYGKIDRGFRESLNKLAARTGGRFVSVEPEVVSLKDALSRVYREVMETQTVVAYFNGLPEGEGPSTERVAVELVLPDDGKSLSDTLDATVPLPPSTETTRQAEERRLAEVEKEKDDLEKAKAAEQKELEATEAKRKQEESKRQQEEVRRIEKQRANWSKWLLVAVLLVLVAGAVAYAARARRKVEVREDRDRIDPTVYSGPATTRPPEEARDAVRRTRVGTFISPAVPEGPVALLACIGGPLQGQEFAVDKALFNLGAKPDNDLVIVGDDYVSGKHAYLRYEQGGLSVCDRHSRNGTFLNDTPVTDAPLAVHARDRIRVGISIFEVVMVSGGPGAGAA